MSRNKGAAKNSCTCKGKSVEERFQYFEKDLQAFQSGNQKRRREILETADPCFIKLLCEVAVNILKENIQLPESQYEILKPHKQLLLKICSRALSLKRKRKILQKAIGAFLYQILPGIITAVVGHTLIKIVP